MQTGLLISMQCQGHALNWGMCHNASWDCRGASVSTHTNMSTATLLWPHRRTGNLTNLVLLARGSTQLAPMCSCDHALGCLGVQHAQSLVRHVHACAHASPCMQVAASACMKVKLLKYNVTNKQDVKVSAGIELEHPGRGGWRKVGACS